MKRIIPFLFLAFTLLPGCEKETPIPVTEIEEPVMKIMSEVRGYQNWYLGNFRCGLYVPHSYFHGNKYPLVIYLHGHSDTTTWNLQWYNEPIITNDPCIVLTPKCPASESYGWGDSYSPFVSPMMAKTYSMIDSVKKAFNLDEDRFYIYGISMGGYGTYGVIQKNPGMFAAAYTECGKGIVNLASNIVSMPFWIFHGSADPVVPVQPDRDLYQAVLALGGTQIRYTEYPGVGHNVWDYVKNETTLDSWLLAQRRGSVHNVPAALSSFTAEHSADNKVLLQWVLPSASDVLQDDKVWFCRIYRDNVLIQEVYNDKNSYIDSPADISTDHRYYITAVNFYFKESAPSQTVSLSSNGKNN
jgi:hypothetical protein